jgi:hypothetical protein
VGGLLLALPAILPIGVALVAKLQTRKAGRGARGDRGRRAAVIEATGASGAAAEVGRFREPLLLIDQLPSISR